MVVNFVAVVLQPRDGEFVPELPRLNIKFVRTEYIVLNIKQRELMRLYVRGGPWWR